MSVIFRQALLGWCQSWAPLGRRHGAKRPWRPTGSTLLSHTVSQRSWDHAACILVCDGAAAGFASAPGAGSGGGRAQPPPPRLTPLARLTVLAGFAGAAAFIASSFDPSAQQGRQRRAAPPPVAPQQPAATASDPLLDALTGVAQRQEQQQQQSGAEDAGRMRAGEEPGAAQSIPPRVHSSGRPAGPWFTSEDLDAAMQRRALAENRLRGYLHVKQRQVQSWLDQAQAFGRLSREEMERELRSIEDEVNRQSNLIMYGIHDPDARRRYLAEYGCAKWSEQALEVVRSHSPLLELGAGLGHWAAQLSGRGADVLAFDNMSALPVPDLRDPEPRFVGKVLKGDVQEVERHPRRTLLMVYPGPDGMAAAALRRYKGKVLLYVGESRGGVNANPDFFDTLERDWECDRVVDVEPFPEGFEKLWVLRRKGTSRKRGWWS